MVNRLEIPRQSAVFLRKHLESPWGAVCTMFSIPPCSADRCDIMFRNVLFKLIITADVVMAGQEGYLMFSEKVKHIGIVKDLCSCLPPAVILGRKQPSSGIASYDRRMLGDIDICICRHILHHSFYKGKDVRSIALVILSLCLINNIVNDKNDILSYEECIVLRSHDLTIYGCSVQVTFRIFIVVVVSYDRIERNAGADNLLLPAFEKFRHIPAHITEGKAYCLSGK